MVVETKDVRTIPIAKPSHSTNKWEYEQSVLGSGREFLGDRGKCSRTTFLVVLRAAYRTLSLSRA